MATTTSMSPGAVLLRGSRMFSLPPKLSPPPASKHLKESTTRTYPTKQTITTGFVSRLNGDWGFKRPLPAKTAMRSSHAYLRINDIDTCEGITDFSSATDHTISLFKWHEMGVPISIPKIEQPTAINDFFTSVFEPEFDYTDVPPLEPGKTSNQDSKRWKFTGPILGEITEGRFQKFVKNQVIPKREAFRNFLRAELAAEKTAEDRRRALVEGDNLPSHPVDPKSIPDDILVAELRILREDKRRLLFLVRQFLDLAPTQLNQELSETPTTVSAGNPWSQSGPPRTHPSAGMMYSRTNSYLDNHPFYGPQKYHPPVRSRVLIPASNPSERPILGVGGWAVDTSNSPAVAAKTKDSKASSMALSFLNPDLPVSPRIWIKVVNAFITSDGKLRLKVDAPVGAQVMVQRELQGESAGKDIVNPDDRQTSLPKRISPYKSYPTVPGSSQSYGLGGDDKKQHPPLGM